MRTRTLINKGWRFYPADIETVTPQIKGPSYIQAKTERFLGGPASRFFPDTPDDYYRGDGEIALLRWENTDLPHDYIINQEYHEKLNNAWGFKEYHPAWYRKHLTISREDMDYRIVLYFEGIADRADVYFNGCEMYHSYQGNTPFEIDITDFIRFDEDNVIAIRVECGTGEGWWYQGGGIYRNVWLEKYEKLAVDRYGIYVNPARNEGPWIEVPEESGLWTVPCEVTVRNDDDEEGETRVRTRIFRADADGQKIGLCKAESETTVTIPPREKKTVRLTSVVEDPDLWSTESPDLYVMEVTLKIGSSTIDCDTTTFGFRTIYFCNEKGFYLNGRNIKLKGVCGHGDYGLTGRAVDDAVYRYKAKLIRDMGANAYRCSHYPQAEYWMDEMDRKGILVMDEVRWFSSTEEGLRELGVLMKRDRNHPSVILWSIGNEEPFFITTQGERITRTMYREAKKYDADRPIITANNWDPELATVYDRSDIVGVNYNMQLFDKLHEIYPEKPMLSTENSATGTIRGWYEDNVPELGRISAYDHKTNEAFLSREETWQFIYDRPWLMGGMQWIAFEHRGEAAWPRVCSASGAIDLFLQKKDAFYQNQSFWLEKPMVHLLPHWNWPHRIGEKIRVFAYTNCEEVELFLNGSSLGKRSIVPVQHAEWMVEYEPGTLEVVAMNGGVIVARDKVETTGPAVRLKLLAENAGDVKPGEVLILTCRAVDAEGRYVPDAAPTVTFWSSEAGSVIATGSDNTDHVPQNITTRKMYMGAISVAVRTGLGEGPIKVTAMADGLIGNDLIVDLS